MLFAIEIDGDVPVAPNDFLKGDLSNVWDEIFTRPRLRGMQERKVYRSLGKMLLFVALIIDWSTKYDMKAPMTTVPTRYCRIVADVTEGMGQRPWSRKGLSSLKRRVEMFRKMLADTFHKHCDSDL